MVLRLVRGESFTWWVVISHLLRLKNVKRKSLCQKSNISYALYIHKHHCIYLYVVFIFGYRNCSGFQPGGPMSSAQKTSKKFTTKKLPTLRLVEKETSQKKRLQKIGDDALANYVLNAYKGEKKTEAGIKYWFEQNVTGHVTEDSKKGGSPDGYTPGWLVLELKGTQEAWLEGLFQGLSRKELSFHRLVVASHNFLFVFPGPSTKVDGWSERKLKEWKGYVDAAQRANGSPSQIGKALAKTYKTKKRLISECAIFSWSPNENETLLPISQSEDEAISLFKKIVTSIDKKIARVEITPKNFSDTLKSLLPFFDESLDKKFEAVHGFFRCMSFWNSAHNPIISDDPAERDRVYLGGGYFEGLRPEGRKNFIQVLSNYEVRNTDKARFYAHYDKAIDAVDPEYRANHGIYFTNEYLARLAITLSEKHLGSIAEKYIVFDPACGSGNLVTSWNHHLDLRHKVVSEISPLLLKAFELRFQGKSSEQRKGFTIIPKTSTGEGLNFVDRAASDYLDRINSELKQKRYKLNKPLAVICNPPYRNQKSIKDDFYKYKVHESLIEIAGKDASNELFVAFLAQISEICRLAEEGGFPSDSVVLLFTKSVWLTGKSSYNSISKYFLKRFEDTMGFVVDSQEFFDVKQSWPLMVSLWKYRPEADLDENRKIEFKNYMPLKRNQLKELIGDTSKDFDNLSNWGTDDVFKAKLKRLLSSAEESPVIFNQPINKLKDNIPPQIGDGNGEITPELIEMDAISGGLCFMTPSQESDRNKKFNERVLPIYEKNLELKKRGKKVEKLPSFKVQGHPLGENIGFTEAKQPFRTKRKFPNDGKRLFFLMDTRFIKMKTSQCFSGVPTTRGHVIESLDLQEKNLIIGYAMAQSLHGNYPVQFDQFDMWLPRTTLQQYDKLFEMASAFLYASNGCIECEVPAHLPVDDAPRVFVTNPMSPNKGTFWDTKLKKICDNSSIEVVQHAVKSVNDLYKEWKKWIQENPSFEAITDLPIYQHTPNRKPLDGWGLFQIDHEIKRMDEPNKLHSLNDKRKELIKKIKEEICRFLKEDIKYWG